MTINSKSSKDCARTENTASGKKGMPLRTDMTTEMYGVIVGYRGYNVWSTQAQRVPGLNIWRRTTKKKPAGLSAAARP